MKSYAVIGANYGDEGKGVITDYLTKCLHNQLVCRFNGGCQAGHTVVKSSDIKHVFHHVGSGTFENADTYLGPNFIVNPYLLPTELAELSNKGKHPRIYCNINAPITTIYDMAINVIVESSRTNRHGSCGLGINETVTRNSHGFTLVVADLLKPKFILLDKIEQIHQRWVDYRLGILGIESISDALHDKTARVLFNNDYHYNEHADKLLSVLDDLDISFNDDDTDWNNIVLEGAQGLGLDEDLGIFPHVTRSLTGLPQAINVSINHNITEIQPVYVSRCYTTRHGAGPLLHEGQVITGSPLFDSTNIENEWQGKIRYAPLNLQRMKELITKDRNRCSSTDITIGDPVLAITCLDQIVDYIMLYDTSGNTRIFTDANQLIDFIEKDMNIKVQFICDGTSSEHVTRLF